MLLCRWTYKTAAGAFKVEVFATATPVACGEGCEVSIVYHAEAYNFAGMGADFHGGEKENWIHLYHEEFQGIDQSTVQDQVRGGQDPLFERYKRDASFQTTFGSKCETMAAVYEERILHSSTPAALVASGCRGPIL